MSVRYSAAFTALLAAALFGATTPLAKTLLGTMSPFMVAGLFYLGSGVGLAIAIAFQRVRRSENERANESRIQLAEVPWLLGAIAAGGVAGPVLLMFGLSTTPAATSSLLLNLEGVFTAVIAWVVFRENVDAQIFLGMVAIVAGGVALSWQPGAAGVSAGALLVAAACACWAIDNNLTRKVSTNDAMVIACLKGLIAGSVNLGIALLFGAHLPGFGKTAAAMFRIRRKPGVVRRRVAQPRHRAHGRVFFSGAAIRRDAVADPVAGYAGCTILGSSRVDGAGRVAAYS
jgi:drug/metabolite transporter (DMT)-like permease